MSPWHSLLSPRRVDHRGREPFHRLHQPHGAALVLPKVPHARGDARVVAEAHAVAEDAEESDHRPKGHLVVQGQEDQHAAAGQERAAWKRPEA